MYPSPKIHTEPPCRITLIRRPRPLPASLEERARALSGADGGLFAVGFRIDGRASEVFSLFLHHTLLERERNRPRLHNNAALTLKPQSNLIIGVWNMLNFIPSNKISVAFYKVD